MAATRASAARVDGRNGQHSIANAVESPTPTGTDVVPTATNASTNAQSTPTEPGAVATVSAVANPTSASVDTPPVVTAPTASTKSPGNAGGVSNQTNALKVPAIRASAVSFTATVKDRTTAIGIDSPIANAGGDTSTKLAGVAATDSFNVDAAAPSTTGVKVPSTTANTATNSSPHASANAAATAATATSVAPTVAAAPSVGPSTDSDPPARASPSSPSYKPKPPPASTTVPTQDTIIKVPAKAKTM